MSYRKHELGGSWVIRDERGEVAAFRPDETLADRCIESLEKSGQFEDSATIPVWLHGGRFYCDAHRKGMPFFFGPDNAKCADCEPESPESFLRNSTYTAKELQRTGEEATAIDAKA